MVINQKQYVVYLQFNFFLMKVLKSSNDAAIICNILSMSFLQKGINIFIYV